MQTISVLIVENDLLIAEDTSRKLNKLGYKVTEVVTNAVDALKSIEGQVPDVILMDIDIDGDMDGISLAQEINVKRNIPIVYLTDLNDPRTLNRTQQTHQAVFMNKPFNEHLLSYNIELAYTLNAGQENSEDLGLIDNALFLRPTGKSGKREKVDFDKIGYIKASRAYSEIYVQHDPKNKLVKYEPAVSMSEVFKQLSSPPFIQVHRSYVVNLNFVEAMEEEDLIVCGIPIPMGPSFKVEIKKRLKII